MYGLLSRTLFAITVASAAVVLAVSSASAATFVVSGANADGSATGDAATTTLTTPNATLTCGASHIEFSDLDNGTQNGTPIAIIDGLTLVGCNFSFIQLTVTADASPAAPWGLNALSESGGVVQGQITRDVRIHIHGTNAPCEADLVGTVSITYVDGTGDISIIGTLTALNVVGCDGLLRENDSATFQAEYFLDPPVVITQVG